MVRVHISLCSKWQVPFTNRPALPAMPRSHVTPCNNYNSGDVIWYNDVARGFLPNTLVSFFILVPWRGKYTSRAICIVRLDARCVVYVCVCFLFVQVFNSTHHCAGPLYCRKRTRSYCRSCHGSNSACWIEPEALQIQREREEASVVEERPSARPGKNS